MKQLIYKSGAILATIHLSSIKHMVQPVPMQSQTHLQSTAKLGCAQTDKDQASMEDSLSLDDALLITQDCLADGCASSSDQKQAANQNNQAT